MPEHVPGLVARSLISAGLSGHAGMEAAVANLVEPGEKILIINTGIWGVRAAELSNRYGGAAFVQGIVQSVVYRTQTVAAREVGSRLSGMPLTPCSGGCGAERGSRQVGEAGGHCGGAAGAQARGAVRVPGRVVIRRAAEPCGCDSGRQTMQLLCCHQDTSG